MPAKTTFTLFRFSTGLLFTILFFGQSALSQTVTLTNFLRTPVEGGTPLAAENLQVDLLQSGQVLQQALLVDANGEIELTGLAAGTYTLGLRPDLSSGTSGDLTDNGAYAPLDIDIQLSGNNETVDLSQAMPSGTLVAASDRIKITVTETTDPSEASSLADGDPVVGMSFSFLGNDGTAPQFTNNIDGSVDFATVTKTNASGVAYAALPDTLGDNDEILIDGLKDGATSVFEEVELPASGEGIGGPSEGPP